MSKFKPLISVILPVYNGEKYLHESIKSILNQTFDNFELFIIDDNSQDSSIQIIKSYPDIRIRLKHNHKNLGLSATLNRGIKLSHGQYVARQDQDDIAYPTRLEKQATFLLSHPGYGMVGTWAHVWRENERTNNYHKHPIDTMILKFFLLFQNPFVHSSIMLRREVFDHVGLYSTDSKRQPPEDYELWSRIARNYDVANIGEILQVYRETKMSMSRDEANPFDQRLLSISCENIAFASGRKSLDRDVIDLCALLQGNMSRLSVKPNFHAISFILNEAAKSIEKRHNNGTNKKLLDTLVSATMNKMKRQYFIHHYSKIFRRLS